MNNGQVEGEERKRLHFARSMGEEGNRRDRNKGDMILKMEKKASAKKYLKEFKNLLRKVDILPKK